MSTEKQQYKAVSYYVHPKSKKKHVITSTITIDPEFEDKLDELMSCEIPYSELEYV